MASPLRTFINCPIYFQLSEKPANSQQSPLCNWVCRTRSAATAPHPDALHISRFWKLSHMSAYSQISLSWITESPTVVPGGRRCWFSCVGLCLIQHLLFECLTFLIKTYKVSGVLAAFALGNEKEARCERNCTMMNWARYYLPSCDFSVFFVYCELSCQSFGSGQVK